MDISLLLMCLTCYLGAAFGLLVFIIKIGELPTDYKPDDSWPWHPPDEHNACLTITLMLLVPGIMTQYFGPGVGFVTLLCWPLWLIYMIIADLIVEMVRFI